MAKKKRKPPRKTKPQGDIMGSSWSGFQPQNELVKLQWAVLEVSEFKITRQEFESLLAISGLMKSADNDESADLEGLETPRKP